jgi:integrase
VGRGGFGGYAKPRETLNKAIGIADWRLHDIRRTVATKLGDDLGVQPHIVEAILNHVSGHKAGVAGVYNHAIYRKEKAQALTAWADHVKKIVAGGKSNIRPLRKEAPA